MTITALGHWQGDPRQHCGSLMLQTKKAFEAVQLARLTRVLSDPDQRDRLLEAAEAIEDEAAARLAPVPA